MNENDLVIEKNSFNYISPEIILRLIMKIIIQVLEEI